MRTHHLAVPVLSALLALLPAAPAPAQTTHQSASTTTAAAKKHPSHATSARHVPVVAPHRATPVRRALRPTSANPTLPKPAPAKPVARAAPVAPKKPEPPPVPADVGTNTGLHLPRFAALKSDDVNMRSGPGERYPVLWKYQRRDLPVKIEREFDVWRLVEDMDGTKGWVHQATLTGRRGFVVTGTEDVILRAQAVDTADAVAVLKPGVIGRVRACAADGAWCQVQVQSYQGFLKRAAFYGVLDGEAVTP